MGTIAIDFDGTLHPYTDGWQGTAVVGDEPPDPHVWVALERFRADGHKLVVFSARANDPEGVEAIWRWLREYKLDHHIAKVTHEKPTALVYIDDRAYRHEGDWQVTATAVHEILELLGR